MQLDKLPSPRLLKRQHPATTMQLAFIERSRQTLIDILEGNDPRLALIVGPCSIHDSLAAQEFAERLNALAKEVSDEFFLLMRTYFEKPRTTVGWKGLVYDPQMDGSHDLVNGLAQARDLLLALADQRVPAATEFLDPMTPRYLEDLVTWSCIGARTTESQIHRQFASGLPMPVAFKNNTSGDLEVAVNAVIAASHPHTCFGIDEEGQAAIMRTRGNPFSHIVLRGGKAHSNYDPQSLAQALTLLRKAHLPLRLLIDCTHGNSRKDHNEQVAVFESVLQQFMQGNQAIRGILLESHLAEGSQALPKHLRELNYGVSVTDPCLGWDSTEKLILEGAKQLRTRRENESQRLACLEKALF